METVEPMEAWTSPFAGPTVDISASRGEEETPARPFGYAAGPAASPFAEAVTEPDGRQTAEAQWQNLVDELSDETFDEALDGLVDEAARRYLRARSRSSAGPDTAAQDVEAWLAERAEVVDRALARLDAEYADRPMSEAEVEALADSIAGIPQAEGDAPAAATEQFLGGLVRKAAKAATSLARAGISTLGALLPGRIFGLLRRLARPLLKRVLDKALGRLPAPLQGPARTLAAKLGLGEDETTEAFSLGETFDQELAQLLLAPTDRQVDELLTELEAEASGAAPDPLSQLDRARAALTEQLATAEPGDRPPSSSSSSSPQ